MARVRMSVDTSIMQARPLPCRSAFPLAEELTPAVDAWTAFRRVAHLPHALFLDSALAGPPLGRYSYVTADPFAWLIGRGPQAAEPFHRLEELLRVYSAEPLPDRPPFQGGAAGLFGYDLCHHFER